MTGTIGDNMFFKPKWYRMLPDSVKPIDDAIINKMTELINTIKELQKFSGITDGLGGIDEVLSMRIMTTRWAVKRIQKFCLEQYKKQMPNASDRELWTGVLLSRFQVKLSMAMAPADPFSKPLSSEEILSRVENVANIVSGFKSFDDVVNYIIAIDE